MYELSYTGSTHWRFETTVNIHNIATPHLYPTLPRHGRNLTTHKIIFNEIEHCVWNVGYCQKYSMNKNQPHAFWQFAKYLCAPFLMMNYINYYWAQFHTNIKSRFHIYRLFLILCTHALQLSYSWMYQAYVLPMLVLLFAH